MVICLYMSYVAVYVTDVYLWQFGLQNFTYMDIYGQISKLTVAYLMH